MALARITRVMLKRSDKYPCLVYSLRMKESMQSFTKMLTVVFWVDVLHHVPFYSYVENFFSSSQMLDFANSFFLNLQNSYSVMTRENSG